MAFGKSFITTALACLAIVSVHKDENLSFVSRFLDGKTYVYKFEAVIAVGFSKPAEFQSGYAIQGKFYISRPKSDVLLVTLQNASYSLNNGRSEDSQNASFSEPISEATKILESPIILYYNESELIAMQLSKKESLWSKNIKFGLASLFQINLNNAVFESPDQLQAYESSEKTVYGECPINYITNSKYPGYNSTGTLVINKLINPLACDQFYNQDFNYNPDTPDESRYSTTNIQSFEIKQGEDNSFVFSLIKSVGEFRYFPFSIDKGDAYFIRNNVTFELEEILSSSEVSLPAVNFENSPLIFDWTYQSPSGSYAEGAAPDVTNGLHIVYQENIVNEAKQLLENVARFIGENQFEAQELDWQRIKSVNKILAILSRADVSSLEKIFLEFQNQTSPAYYTTRGIFLGILSQVGTTASSSFAWSLVKSESIGGFEAMELLNKLSFNAREPSEDLLVKLEPMLCDNESLSPKVRKSAILAFSTLVSRTFTDVTANENNESVKKYVKMYADHLYNATDFGFQLVYLTALGNIQNKYILDYLIPIVRGEVKISENPDYLRLLAIRGAQKPLLPKYSRGFELFAPIVTDYKLSTPVRVPALEYLFNNAKSLGNLTSLNKLMDKEPNEQFYNYFYSLITNAANSTDPSNPKLKKHAAKMLPIARRPALASDNVSTSQIIDKVDSNGNGLQFKFSIIYNDVTKVLEQFYMGQSIFENGKAASNWGFYMNIASRDNIMRFFNAGMLDLEKIISPAMIFETIKKIPAAIIANENSTIDMIVLCKDRPVMTNNYKNISWLNFQNEVDQIEKYILPSNAAPQNSNQTNLYQGVTYFTFSEYSFIDLTGMRSFFSAKSPIVYKMEVSNNQAAGSTLKTTQVDVKFWFTHEYDASVYNPFTDSWHTAGQTSVIIAQVSLENNVHINSALKFLKISNPTSWNVKLTGADVIIVNKNNVFIEKYNTNSLNSSSTYNHEVTAAKNVTINKNSAKFLTEIDGFKWEIISFGGENHGKISGEKWIEIFQDIKNYELGLFSVPNKLKNRGVLIKIKQDIGFILLSLLKYGTRCIK